VSKSTKMGYLRTFGCRLPVSSLTSVHPYSVSWPEQAHSSPLTARQERFWNTLEVLSVIACLQHVSTHKRLNALCFCDTPSAGITRSRTFSTTGN
jgi:hypothetical protein